MDVASVGAAFGLSAAAGLNAWLPLFAGALPHSLLAMPQLEAFRKLYGAAADSPCLVVGDERGTTRWFSPKFGLVRERILGGWTRDLVYWRGAP